MGYLQRSTLRLRYSSLVVKSFRTIVNKALLVGINKYPKAPLRGCLNDVADMGKLLTTRCEFSSSDIRVLADQKATAAEIKNQLAWLVTNLKAGDRVLFHYSGHGARMPLMGKGSKVTSLAEVICPVDFNWTPESAVTDQDFTQTFATIPLGVEFIWISDSCHSAGLDREVSSKKKVTYRTMKPPVAILRKIQIAEEANLKVTRINKSASMLNTVLIAGCKSDQTSADACFDGRYSGALTYCLLQELNKGDGLAVPLVSLMPRVVARIKQHSFSQDPQLDGIPQIVQKSFLAK